MKLVAQYVEQAKLFEFLAASEMDAKSKEQFEEQAKTYYELAAERAQLIGAARSAAGRWRDSGVGALPIFAALSSTAAPRSAWEAASTPRSIASASRTRRSRRCARARSGLRYGLNAIARVAR